MPYPGITSTKFGWFHEADAFRAERLHLYRGEPLKVSDWEPPVPVLDQEDLEAQGIDTSALVPGAARVDALGSCTANAGTVHLAQQWSAVHGTAALADIGISATDPVQGEEHAILMYHEVTDQTGNPSTEWPPTDCGSSGLAVCELLERRHLAAGHKSAGDIHALALLLQTGTVMVGAPWFRAWMEPDVHGFIDGDGSVAALERAVASGVAGGHETCITALERLTLNGLGLIDPDKSHARVRNSWSASFGDHGSYRIHLSTWAMLGRYADFRQIQVRKA